MFRPISAILLALTLSQQSVAAQERQDEVRLSLEHRMLLRCSAALAMVANGQEAGEAAALAYPAMGERAREFFVRSSAQVMDEAGLDREQVAALLGAEARQLRDEGVLADVMPVCLGVLDTAGL